MSVRWLRGKEKIDSRRESEFTAQPHKPIGNIDHKTNESWEVNKSNPTVYR